MKELLEQAYSLISKIETTEIDDIYREAQNWIKEFEKHKNNCPDDCKIKTLNSDFNLCMGCIRYSPNLYDKYQPVKN